ncbi:hypothetical protein ACIA5D_24065 [Actinoplanes sp. NPDC051513]|uniref:hypothetical protein n=1 Tax=Actinoplanes sp. NPDC051513 TaxID=3363908 RepID=UPI00378F2A5C
MSRRTRLIPLGVLLLGALTLLSACGTPPQPPLKSPPLASPSAAPLSLPPSALPGLPATTTAPTATATAPTLGAYPTYPTYTYPTYTTPATTVSPTPTPSHAALCAGSPTGPQILALIKGRKGIPKVTLQVDSGPYCSGNWSFTTVEVTGSNEDQLEPLMVVATGKDTTLAFVTAGSDVCINQVQTKAPPGIRVLACGY